MVNNIIQMYYCISNGNITCITKYIVWFYININKTRAMTLIMNIHLDVNEQAIFNIVTKHD